VFQLPPVGRAPIYDPKQRGDLAQAGHMWFSDTHVIVALRKNFRAATRPRWCALLDRFRDGNVTEADLATVNARAVTKSDRMPPPPAGVQRRVLCFTNQERRAINRYAQAIMLDKTHGPDSDHPRQPYGATSPLCIMARCHRRTAGMPLASGLEAKIRDHVVDDRKLGGRPPWLVVAPRTPLMLVANKAPILGYANGSTCQYVATHLREAVEPRWAYCSWVRRHAWCVSSEDILCMQVASTNERIVDEVLVDGLAPGHFLVAPDSTRISLNPAAVGVESASEGTMALRVVQVPAVVAYACTVHKLQGATLDSLVTLPFTSCFGNKKRTIYTALSRVTTEQQLIMMAPLAHGVDYFASDDADPLEMFNKKAKARTERALAELGVVSASEDAPMRQRRRE